jgi:hypothetical protein
MRVSLCRFCPYKPGDIAPYYDKTAERRLCITCPDPHDGRQDQIRHTTQRVKERDVWRTFKRKAQGS